MANRTARKATPMPAPRAKPLPRPSLNLVGHVHLQADGFGGVVITIRRGSTLVGRAFGRCRADVLHEVRQHFGGGVLKRSQAPGTWLVFC